MVDKLEILLKINYLGKQTSSVEKIEYKKCEVEFSGNFMLVSEHGEKGVVTHVHNLNDVKSYRHK